MNTPLVVAEPPTRSHSMANTNRTGNNAPNHDLDIRTTSDSASGSRYTSANELARQRRTRSHHNKSDLVLRLPLSHSPLKVARRANAKAQGTSPMLHSDSHTPRSPQSHLVAHEVTGDAMSAVTEAGTLGTSPLAEVEGEIHAGADGGTKKRPSPDTDVMRALSGPRSERHAKRAKLEAFRSLSDEQEHVEYREHLRDPDTGSPGRPKSYKRASSTKPRPSPSKVSIFHSRAQSVPLDGEDTVRTIDFTSIPPSPRRSPSKVEIQRAPSAPPPDEDRMDVDDAFGLLQFTNATQVSSPRADPVFRFTVNFATPLKATTPARSNLASAPPLSPLSPLTPSPPMECFPRMKSLLAKQAMANSLSQRKNSDASTSYVGSAVIASAADTTALDVFQFAAHVPRPPSPAVPTLRGVSATPAAPQSHLRRPMTWSKPMVLMPPPAAPAEAQDVVHDTVGPGEGTEPLLNELNGAGRSSTDTPLDLPAAPTSRPSSVAVPVSRRTVIGSMKPKRGPSVPQGAKRVTRSVSMKEQRVTCERTAVEDATGEAPEDATDSAAEPSLEVAGMPPPSASELGTLKSTGPVTLRGNIPTTRHRSVSVSKLLPDASKLKQSSLFAFVKGKASAAGGTTSSSNLNASTSTSAVGPSRTPAVPSPSKIPLPASPLKRLSTSQSGNTKPCLFSLGSTSTGAGTGAARSTSGRTLTTLSHALDKLAAPPPSRPNTSMGFVRGDGSGEEDNTPENSKGKSKVKDDTSLPHVSTTQGRGTAFARPTASSLKRAATVTGFGSTAVSRIRGRGGAALGGPARGRGIFGKVGDRASKKTTLPMVTGSPVKGSEVRDDIDEDDQAADKEALGLGAKDATGDEDVFASRDVEMQNPSTSSTGGRSAASHKPSPPAAQASNGTQIDITSSPISTDKGKQRAMPPSTLNPASAALHALSESLSSLPQTPTPPKPRAPGTRTGLRSSTAAKESPTGSSSAGPGRDGEVHGSGGTGPSSGTVNGSGGVKKSSLKILKRCAIFVDVRTEQGDDAGSLFVDMLKGLGAKIMGRLGQSCTHIVYKNGLPHTLTRYRMLNDPKPIVVGIAWVVECVEKRARVDEEKFKVDVDVINVAGNNHKRRRSMLPKHLIPVSPGPDFDGPVNMSSEADEADEGGVDGSPAQDPDISIRSREEDDLPPLERARRRRSVLPGGQTRLFTR